MKRNILHLFHFPWITTGLTFDFELLKSRLAFRGRRKRVVYNTRMCLFRRIPCFSLILLCAVKRNTSCISILVNMLRCLSRIHNQNIIYSLHITRIHHLEIDQGSLSLSRTSYVILSNFWLRRGAQGEGILCVRVCVRASVRPFGIFCKMTVKMSSRSILKSPGGF